MRHSIVFLSSHTTENGTCFPPAEDSAQDASEKLSGFPRELKRGFPSMLAEESPVKRPHAAFEWTTVYGAVASVISLQVRKNSGVSTSSSQ